MVKVRLAVSAFYDDQTYATGADVPCDVEFAKRVVLYGHAQLLDKDDAPMTFEDACHARRSGGRPRDGRRSAKDYRS